MVGFFNKEYNKLNQEIKNVGALPWMNIPKKIVQGGISEIKGLAERAKVPSLGEIMSAQIAKRQMNQEKNLGSVSAAMRVRRQQIQELR